MQEIETVPMAVKEFRTVKANGDIDSRINDMIETMRFIESHPGKVVVTSELIDSITYLNESYSLMDYANTFCGTKHDSMVMPSAFFKSILNAQRNHSFENQEQLSDYMYLCISYMLTFNVDCYTKLDNSFRRFFDILDSIKTQYYQNL